MSAPLLALAAALLAPPTFGPETAELKTATGTLTAIFDLPVGTGPWPIAILHPGSGPADRDGNLPGMRNDSLKLLGRALAERGVACLRVDKRGVGGSAKAMAKEDDLRFDQLADDAVAWVQLLRTDPRFNRVAFVGHSEGALVGAVAGPAAKFDAYVSLCGPCRRLSEVIREQIRGKLPNDLAAKNEEILQALEAGKLYGGEVPKELEPLYRPSVQPYFASLLKYDPAAAVGKLACPVLVVTGSADLQVVPAEGEKLAAGKPGARHVVIPGMSHVLKQTGETKMPGQLRTVYADPTLPLHPKLAGQLSPFLLGDAAAK